MRLRRKGLLSGHAWSQRRAIVSKDALRVAKGAKTVFTIRLDKAQLDPSATGPKGLQALKVAKALTAHPGLQVRVEGHTNSACGLDCDGSEECLCLRSLPAKRRASFRAMIFSS